MAATRSIASASATEVPPNFRTVVTIAVSHQAFPVHQLSVQNCRAGGAADRVVAERDELVVEHRTRTQASDGDGHPSPAVGVERRLRTIAFGEIFDRWFRRRRQI